MKKISEMSLEELQDYALSLESDKATLNDEKAALTADLTEANNLNKTLQKRNNELFLQVEQQRASEPPATEPPAAVESCEDFAKRLILGDK